MHYPKSTQRKTRRPIVAGVMLILAGLLSLCFWGLLAIFTSITTGTIKIGSVYIDIKSIASIIYIWSFICIVFSIFGVIAGVLAIKRRMINYAILFGLLGFFGIGPFLMSSLLSVAAVVLIVESQQEFT